MVLHSVFYNISKNREEKLEEFDKIVEKEMEEYKVKCQEEEKKKISQDSKQPNSKVMSKTPKFVHQKSLVSRAPISKPAKRFSEAERPPYKNSK